MNNRGKHLFCFGLGFTGRQIAADHPALRVSGTSRSPAGKATADGLPLYPFQRDAGIDGFADLAADVTHILLSIPPDAEGDPVFDTMVEEILRLPKLEWVGYLSTTGVYGNLDGGWVDETSPCNPSGVRGLRRMRAEQAWRGLYEKSGLPVHIFRLPGIYGPGRNQLVSLKAGKARRINKPGQVFSRIHVADLAAILVASMNRPNSGAVYNVADDEPAPPQDVVAYAADLLKMPPPPLIDFDAADLTPMARSFYDDSKRISNVKIKSELGISLQYPTYREGLAALLPAEMGI
ncbi:MAG: NAD(P)-dependent oxidoreductase [Sneathiella sp.]|uniref:SDR family oxidoreductase n=1 Tax=Sneathiella sp. TaxID=1964365 RepID=UPI000C40E82D|nr:SDR family oxidoreductase [Sneathiella sp.]MAL79381.1 NAD(P)-dependent oxidoreductase [Sneathiella sp.]